MHTNRVGVALGALLLVAGASQGQWFQWTAGSGGNDQWYRLTDAVTSWDKAELEAISEGGHLASIHSSGENAFLVSTFLVGNQQGLPLWIGLNDAAVEGTYSWTDSTPLDYSNFQPGEPNDFGGNEDFVAMNWHFAQGAGPMGNWNDTPLNGTTGFGGGTEGPYRGIVKSAVPAPGAMGLIGLAGLLAGRRRR